MFGIKRLYIHHLDVVYFVCAEKVFFEVEIRFNDVRLRFWV